MPKIDIEFVLENQLCLGCGACTQIPGGQNIEMLIDSNGFLRPFAKDGFLVSERFDSVCPGYKIEHIGVKSGWTDLWGPVVETSVGWAKDNDVRYNGSSGGGITASIIGLLELGVIDAALQISVDLNDPLKNIYSITTTVDQAKRNTGSRYAPAAPLEGFVEISQRFKRILIVGKPCDIVAARNLVENIGGYPNNEYYYISFMCAGVPSIHGTHRILQELSVSKEDLIDFRYRGNGWPGFATATSTDGNARQMSYHESWGEILNKNLQLRCKVCIDGTGEFSDITFADAWYGGDDGYPKFEEQSGRSLIILRNENGKRIFDLLKGRYIEHQIISINEIEKMQPYQAVRKKLMLSRVLAMRLVGLNPPKYDFKVMLRNAFDAGLKKNLSSFFGMLKRSLIIRRNAK